MLPPEEATAAAAGGGDLDLAEKENVLLSQGLTASALEAAALRNRLARSQIKNVKADREMRKTYAARILRYLEFYSVGVLFVMLLAGFHVGDFALPEEVLAALVGSTAVAAIGLVGFIARGLFRTPEATSKG